MESCLCLPVSLSPPICYDGYNSQRIPRRDNDRCANEPTRDNEPLANKPARDNDHLANAANEQLSYHHNEKEDKALWSGRDWIVLNNYTAGQRRRRTTAPLPRRYVSL